MPVSELLTHVEGGGCLHLPFIHVRLRVRKVYITIVVDFFSDVICTLISAELICGLVLTVCVNDIKGYVVLGEADGEDSA